MTPAVRTRCAPGRAVGLAGASSALLMSFVLHAPPAAAYGAHHMRHTAGPTAPRTAHRLPTAHPEHGTRPPRNRTAEHAGHPGRTTPPSAHPAEPPHRGPAAAPPAPAAARQPRPERISRPTHGKPAHPKPAPGKPAPGKPAHPKPAPGKPAHPEPAHQRSAGRRRDVVDAVPPDPWQDLDQRLEDQRPDQEDPPEADEARPYATRTVDPLARPFVPPAEPGPAPGVPGASPTGSAVLSGPSDARRPVGPVLNILSLGTGFALTGLGLGFMALRLRRG